MAQLGGVAWLLALAGGRHAQRRASSCTLADESYTGRCVRRGVRWARRGRQGWARVAARTCGASTVHGGAGVGKLPLCFGRGGPGASEVLLRRSGWKRDEKKRALEVAG